MRRPPKPKSQIDSFRYAIEGIAHVFRTQKHMRFHSIAVVLVLGLGMLCRFDALQLSLLALASVGVLVAEMINTSVETVVDMVTQAYHPLAKLAKDIAAGAVFIMAIAAATVGSLLFFSHFQSSFPLIALDAKDRYDASPSMLILLCVLILVIIAIVKMLGGRGSILQGGVVSGHSAVACMLATMILRRIHADIETWVLVILLAFLVAQSRIDGKVHTFQEVLLGGLIGICVTAGVSFLRIGAH
jgi:diacylglycerol kinase (ATP)